MARRDPIQSVIDVHNHAREAIALIKNCSRENLDNDRVLALALRKLVEIIGEAAYRVPKEFQDNHPDIMWGKIVGMRNRLVHGYDAVDLDVLWSVVKFDLPILATQMEAMIKDENI
ncbi:MAG: DUF86 domain-containing protein [Gammaproteobacteria bacterium]|nr:DUF86 domain-containing protein [Gammaproteobacteria bacterium]